MNKSKVDKLKVSIVVILLLLVFGAIQNYKNVDTIGNYDLVILDMLESELHDLVSLSEANELTQEKYKHYRGNIKLILNLIAESRNLRFMEFDIYNMVNSRDKSTFENRLEKNKAFQLKLLELSKEQNTGIRTFKYFRDEDNQKELLELISFD